MVQCLVTLWTVSLSLVSAPCKFSERVGSQCCILACFNMRVFNTALLWCYEFCLWSAPTLCLTKCLRPVTVVMYSEPVSGGGSPNCTKCQFLLKTHGNCQIQVKSCGSFVLRDSLIIIVASLLPYFLQWDWRNKPLILCQILLSGAGSLPSPVLGDTVHPISRHGAIKKISKWGECCLRFYFLVLVHCRVPSLETHFTLFQDTVPSKWSWSCYFKVKR